MAGLGIAGCQRDTIAPSSSSAPRSFTAADPLSIALAPHAGDKHIDQEIRECQARVRTASRPETALEQLGWLFIAKARETFDPGFYKLAEQCALGLETRRPGSFEGLLLRGHALHSQHRFREAEALANELVKQRGISADHGLLGDVLMDLGRVDEAAGAYQTMLDLKPDPLGYARAAHIRWLKGNLEGAIEVMRMAARGASPRDPDSAAWIHTQLARYLWQTHANGEARRALQIALQFKSDYAPARFWSGRMLLDAGRTDEAIQVLRQAAEVNPLPEYQWALADALRAVRREDEARLLEKKILEQGAVTDPRTFSLYLATRGEQLETTVRLARRELEDRRDIFTHDALAWALMAAGKIEEAQAHMTRALSEGTQDGRLFLHATVLAVRTGKISEAREWMTKATELSSLLLPSEREQLNAAAALIPHLSLSRASSSLTPSSRSFPAVAPRSTEGEN
jgi:tetratricopeptide (TPR) repeat protein